LFALSGFILGKASYFGMYSRVLFSIGALFLLFIIHLVNMIKTFIARGKFFIWKRSNFYNPITKSIKWISVIAVILDALLQFVSTSAFIFSLQYAVYAGIN